MCGIFGAYSPNHSALPEIETQLNKGIRYLHNRGPDGNSTWIHKNGYVGFAHARLSIIELSDFGTQPKKSKNHRFCLTYNGEIYNHLEIRDALQAEYNFNSDYWDSGSDTETLVEALAFWGLKKTLQSIEGMFAFALWDDLKQRLFLARDRMGEKPLYYGWIGSNLYFSSDLSAFKSNPYFNNSISRDALDLYTQFNYVPAPYSIFEDIYKLQPGTFIQFNQGASRIDNTSYPLEKSEYVKSEFFWSLEEQILSRNQGNLSEQVAESLVEAALLKSIKSQMISDVPLGAFLSGGIDSSLVVALMGQVHSSPIKTFTIGFHEEHLNEAPYAKKIAEHLGADHTELYVHMDDMKDIIPKIPKIYSEPFADSSQIPTFLVSELASKHVKVALSGDAGDELFGGYNRYFWSKRIWNKISWMPLAFRQRLGRVIEGIPTHKLDTAYGVLEHLLPKNLHINQFGYKVSKLAIRLRNVSSLEDLYLSLVKEWQASSCLQFDTNQKSYVLNNQLQKFSQLDFRERMMYWDSMSYLPDDILCKVDRAAMHNSLETRCPFLDPTVIDAAWNTPLEYKFRKNSGKLILKSILSKYIPLELFERPKAGFAVPIDSWLRSSLKPWASELLSKQRIQKDGFFSFDSVEKSWNQHLNGQDQHNALWSVLMFNSWADDFKDQKLK